MPQCGQNIVPSLRWCKEGLLPLFFTYVITLQIATFVSCGHFAQM